MAQVRHVVDRGSRSSCPLRSSASLLPTLRGTDAQTAFSSRAQRRLFFGVADSPLRARPAQIMLVGGGPADENLREPTRQRRWEKQGSPVLRTTTSLQAQSRGRSTADLTDYEAIIDAVAAAQTIQER